jgi:hypothetical protein
VLILGKLLCLGLGESQTGKGQVEKAYPRAAHGEDSPRALALGPPILQFCSQARLLECHASRPESMGGGGVHLLLQDVQLGWDGLYGH